MRDVKDIGNAASHRNLVGRLNRCAKALVGIVGITLCAFVLFSVDRHFNPRIPEVTGSRIRGEANTPQIEIRLLHLCCSGCQQTAVSALHQMAWWRIKDGKDEIVRLHSTLPTSVGQCRLNPEVAVSTPHTDTSGALVAKIQSSRLADMEFVRLNRVLREVGLIPDRIVVRGLPRFRLVVNLPHFCCHDCRNAVQEVFTGKVGEPALPGLHLPHMLGTVSVDYVQHQAVATFEQEADVSGFVQAVERSGFAPIAVKIDVLTGR